MKYNKITYIDHDVSDNHLLTTGNQVNNERQW